MKMWTDILSSKEAIYTQKVIDTLNDVNWAKPLINNINKNGRLCSEAMPLLFEARFAYELYIANISAKYEYPAGVGNSTIEFKLDTSPAWFVELVSIRESKPLKEATIEEETWFGHEYTRELSTNAKDPLQSEEAEMIRVGAKIGEKVFSKGTPTKFPIPQNSYHLILVDMRGFLGHGGDEYDYEHIACGYRSKNPFPPHCWNREIIKGIFEKSNTKLKAAKTLQERIHFIGFISEKEYVENEIKNKTFYALNKNLVTNIEELNKILETYPLKTESMKA